MNLIYIIEDEKLSFQDAPVASGDNDLLNFTFPIFLLFLNISEILSIKRWKVLHTKAEL